MAVMLITHNLGVIAEMADDVAVMYLGRVVEHASVRELFRSPQHPYTQALLRSIPSLHNPPRQPLATIEGTVPHPLNRPTGCPFHPRCDLAIAGICDTHDPILQPVGVPMAATVLSVVSSTTPIKRWRLRRHPEFSDDRDTKWCADPS